MLDLKRTGTGKQGQDVGTGIGLLSRTQNGPGLKRKN